MRYFRLPSVVVIIAAILLSMGLTPQPAFAADIVVDGTHYSCDQAGLTSAITAVGSSGTVNFNCPSPYTINFTSPITIGDSAPQTITIDGSNNGHPMIFDGGDSTNFFAVLTTGDLTVQHMTMQHGLGFDNGDGNQEGGAIDVDGQGLLTVTTVTFTDNNGGTDGGAIDNDDGTVVVTQSSFSNNQAHDYGGAIYSNNAITITQSTFDNNQTNIGGGAFYNGDIATVTQSTFNNNRAEDGGAIQNWYEITIAQSSFTNNQAYVDGGAIQSDEPLIVINSSFIDNHADQTGGAIATGSAGLNIAATTFSGNTAELAGSTLFLGSLETNISWSTIIQPDGEDTPAIYLESLNELSLEGVILGGYGTHCQFDSEYLTIINTLANDDSCDPTSSADWENQNLLLGPRATTTVNGVDQTYYPLMVGSPAFNAGPSSCDVVIDQDTTVTTDQLGTPRPVSEFCDIGAIEGFILYPAELCVNSWTGALRMPSRGDCSRTETTISIPQFPWPTLCVNDWNGATRLANADDCSRSEYAITITGDHSIPVCVNDWNGTLRVSDQCTRSETQRRL